MITFENAVQAAAEVVNQATIQYGLDVTYQRMYPEHEGTGTNGCWYGEDSYRQHEGGGNLGIQRSPEGKPACIVGRILDRLGLFGYVEETNAPSDPIFAASQDGLIEYEEANRIADYLASLQTDQDNGIPWAETFIYHTATDLMPKESD